MWGGVRYDLNLLRDVLLSWIERDSNVVTNITPKSSLLILLKEDLKIEIWDAEMESGKVMSHNVDRSILWNLTAPAPFNSNLASNKISATHNHNGDW